MTQYELGSLVTASISIVVSIYFGMKSYSSDKELKSLREKLKEYGNDTDLISYIRQYVIMLGPRLSGKTSIVQKLTKPWTDVMEIARSHNWDKSTLDICELNTEKEYQALFGTSRNVVKTLRLDIFDYPGEDKYKTDAISELEGLRNAVIVFLFNVEVESSNIVSASLNNSYYSKVFMDLIEKRVDVLNSIAKAIIVFNKIDLLPQGMSESEQLTCLTNANKDACDRISSVFSGRLEYFMVSTIVNTGMLNLLGSIASEGLPKEQKKKVIDALLNVSSKDKKDKKPGK